MSAYIGLGITEGAKSALAYHRGADLREMQRAEAKNRQKLSEMQLSDYKNNESVREQQRDTDLAVLRQQARVANQQNLKSVTYSAFDKYVADSDTRHLNNMLPEVMKNPIGAKANSNIVRYDPLVDTPEIRKQMSDAGFTDFDGILASDEVRKNFVVSTGRDGKQTVWDVNKVFAASGYLKHMQTEKLEQAKRSLELNQMLGNGAKLTDVQFKENIVQSMMKSEGIPRHEAWRKMREIEQGGAKGQDLAAINLIAEEEKISTLDATKKYYDLKNSGKGQTDQERYVQDYLASNEGSTREQAVDAYANRTDTKDIKNIDAADSERDKLDDLGFFDKDISSLDKSERIKLQRSVDKIQTLSGLEISNQDKALFSDLRSLANLGGIAGEELTPEETGLVDSMLNSVKKYMFNEIGGSEATSAYETFRNIFRNSLYGASLTETETKAFNKAAGTLEQRFKPVMSRLRTQMLDIKSKMETARDFNEPYVSHFYLGGAVDDIDKSIRGIEERIDFMNSYESNNKLDFVDEQSDDWKAALEDI